MATHIGNININVDTTQVRNASTALAALGTQATATQRLLNSLSTVNLSPATTAANNLSQSLTHVAQHAATATANMTALGQAGGNMGNGFGSANTGLSGFIQNLTGLGAGPQLLLGIGSAIIGVGKSLFDAYQPVQSLRMGLNALGQDGNSAMMSMVQTANSIGVSFSSVSKGLLQFSAATAGTSLEGAKANEIFANVAGSVKLFGGATENVDGAMRALTQMLGKGTVSSEELRQQLGEHVPSAFRLGAEAMGMSQAELSKALKAGAIDAEGFLTRLSELMRDKYGKGIEDAAKTTKSQLAIAGNDWQLFTANAGKSIDGLLLSLVELINQTRILKELNVSGVMKSTLESNAGAAQRQGFGANGDDALATFKIQALQKSGYKGKLKTTEQESDAFGNVTERVLSASEVWAQAAADAYKTGNSDLIKRMGGIDGVMNDFDGHNKKQAEAKASAEFKKKNHAEEMTLAAQYRKATETNNKAEKARIEILREQRDLQVRIKGAGDNQEKKDEIIAQSLQRQAEIKAKYEDKKKGGGLTPAQRQDKRADGYDSQIEHMFDRWAIGSTKIQEGAVAAAMQEIELAAERKKEQLDTALKFKEITKARHDTEISNLNAEMAKAKELARTRIEAEEAAKAAKVERENQLKIEQNVLKIMQQQRDEITKVAKENAKRNADLEKIVKNTNRGIGRDLINANPMANKDALKREDYVNGSTDPLTNQLDGLQSKMEQLNEVMGKEDGITQGMMEDYNNLTDTIERTKQAISDMANTSGAAFDKMQADSKSLPLSMTGAANAYIQSVDVAKLSTSLASNTVTEFGSTLSEALGSKEGWKNREQGIKNYFASMLKQISNMVIQLGVVKPLMESVFGGASGSPSSGASMWLGAIAKIGLSLGGGPVEGDTNFMGPMQPVPHAVGGVFGGGHGIYSQPTLFNDSNGRLGVLGEKDPEGILPLKRGKDGKLGVVSSGGGGGSQINNFTPSIIIQGNADDEAIAKMTAALRAEFKQHVSQSINKNNVKSQRPGGTNYGR